MNCTIRFGVIAVLGLGLLAGCSKQSAPNANASADNEVSQIKETDPSSNPVAHATADFLDAMIKGDSQRISARLTPKAMQNIVASGKQLSPPGMDTASFKIGEVRAPSADQAIVQCVITDTSEGTPHSEEMCCLLRLVDNDWRVSGIAYGTAPDKPWTLTDFESGQNMAIPRQTMGGVASTQPAGGAVPDNGVQANGAAQQPVSQSRMGMPPVAGPSGNGGNPGLGMPAVAPAGGTPNYPSAQAPYTASEQQSPERR
ncbi:MAG TPA: hypothetical protein VH107_04360 [Lacipirellulaceae bacterium]|jgi:hypothetical protein|nr:hypothetical protein [Lacipirellulaceae bacterium]